MQTLQHHINNSGFSLLTLSEKAKISAERLKDLIYNDLEPTLGEIRAISKALKVPLDFLIAEDKNAKDTSILFRNAKSKREIFIADKFAYYISNALRLLGESSIKNHALMDILPIVPNTYEGASILANEFRNFFFNGDDISPILNLPQILSDRLDILIYILENEVDGASAIVNRIPFIFIAPRFLPRMLFTLAHELAHLLSHHRVDTDFAVLDKVVASSNASRALQESFANAFASNLLLPKSGVALTLKKVRELKNISKGPIGDIEIIFLSRIYGVSFEVAANRCEDLGLIPKGGAISLYEILMKKHGSPEKRAKELGISDRPEIEFQKVPNVLIQAAIKKISDGEMSIGRASEILTISQLSLIKQHSTYFE